MTHDDPYQPPQAPLEQAPAPAVPPVQATPQPFDQAFNIGRALDHGWKVLKRAPLPLGVGAVIMSLTDGGTFNVPSEFFSGDSQDAESFGDLFNLLGVFGAASSGMDNLGIAVMAAVIFFAVVVAIGFLLLRLWVEPGYFRLHWRLFATGDQGFGPLFSGADRMVDLLLLKLLEFLVLTVTVIASALPGGLVLGLGFGLDKNIALMIVGGGLMGIGLLGAAIYVGLGLTLAGRVLVLEGHKPRDALRRSWELAAGHRWTLFLFVFVFGVLQLAGYLVGMLLCCVGMLLTVPATRAWADVAMTEAFLLHTQGGPGALSWMAGTPAGHA
jgi:hypothetical protein